jgi:hypothetical protein
VCVCVCCGQASDIVSLCSQLFLTQFYGVLRTVDSQLLLIVMLLSHFLFVCLLARLLWLQSSLHQSVGAQRGFGGGGGVKERGGGWE